MKYERFTTDTDRGFTLNCVNCSRYENECTLNHCLAEALNRLAELEDKIEAGTLVEKDTLKEFVKYVKKGLDKNIEWRTKSAEYAEQQDCPTMAEKYWALVDENYNFKEDLDQDLENFIKEKSDENN